MKGVIVLRHLKVENANAIAGHTWGFPAIANFLGFTHALQRQFNEKSGKPELQLLGCGVVCHRHQAHAYKTHEFGDYIFALTRNPVGKDGKSASMVEEGRMHMEVSLVIPFNGEVRGDGKVEADILKQLLYRLRLAGGTIASLKAVQLIKLSSVIDKEKHTRRIMRSLLPGFALVSRQATLAEHQQRRQEVPGPLAEYGCTEPDLQAWLEFASLTYRSNIEDDKVTWERDPNPYGGWLRPIAVGYKAISPLYEPGEVAHSRDLETPVRFVETLYSLGEWLSPHRIKSIEQLYWFYQHDEQKGYYQCVNQYSPQPAATTA